MKLPTSAPGTASMHAIDAKRMATERVGTVDSAGRVSGELKRIGAKSQPPARTPMVFSNSEKTGTACTRDWR